MKDIQRLPPKTHPSKERGVMKTIRDTNDLMRDSWPLVISERPKRVGIPSCVLAAHLHNGEGTRHQTLYTHPSTTNNLRTNTLYSS